MERREREMRRHMRKEDNEGLEVLEVRPIEGFAGLFIVDPVRCRRARQVVACDSV